MKKFCALLLIVLMLAMAMPVALAENTTTLTTTVPDAAYTLNIPADQTIVYGQTATDIGNVTVTNSTNFAVGKNLEVTVTWNAFSCADVNTTIPYTIAARSPSSSTSCTMNSGDVLTYRGKEDGTVIETALPPTGNVLTEVLTVKVNSSDWGRALAGDYSSVITFTAEVVSGN